MKPPASATNPPNTQQPSMRNGVCTCCATTYGLMKMPDPTMPPITIMTASKSPSRRASVMVWPAAVAVGTKKSVLGGGPWVWQLLLVHGGLWVVVAPVEPIVFQHRHRFEARSLHVP